MGYISKKERIKKVGIIRLFVFTTFLNIASVGNQYFGETLHTVKTEDQLQVVVNFRIN